MWILIPDDGREAWGGTISKGDQSGSRWQIELIRHVETLGELHNESPFGEKETVVGLLDYQERCTIIGPLVSSVDPGIVGRLIDNHRTRIEAQCDALLTGVAVSDPNAPLFRSIEITSDAFSAWFAPPVHHAKFDFRTRTPTIEVKSDEFFKFELKEIGNVECVTGSRTTRSDVRNLSMRSSTLFILDFLGVKTLSDARKICFAIERLFGFLVGYRGPMPTFSLYTEKQYQVGDSKVRHKGLLELGGMPFTDRKFPHPMECIHLRGLGDASPQNILEKFFDQSDDILVRIHAVEFCRFFSNNINDKFSVIMPAFESYLRKRYTEPDEESFIHMRDKFFSFVDFGNDDIKNFSLKHLQVKDSKAPSLKKLIGRSIEFVNSKGFAFPADIAQALQDRRGKLFHSVPDMTSADIRKLFTEIQAAMGLLMLHTFDDLGIDISILADRHFALSDIRMFMHMPEPPEHDEGSKLPTPSEVVKQMSEEDKPS